MSYRVSALAFCSIVAAAPGCGQNTLDLLPCGNGEADRGEVCDDGDNNGEYGFCDLDCEAIIRCGDEFVSTEHETCDDGVENGAYGRCNADCSGLLRCGDEVVTAGVEACDDGALNGTYNHCKADCTGDGPRCGNSVHDIAYEACDDGPNNGTYGMCAADCQGLAECGDGFVDTAHESCDDGDNNGFYGYCNIDCTAVATCGDGQIFAGEETCDDGADNGTRGFCNTTCDGSSEFCGDGWVDAPGETCDHGAENGQYQRCNDTCTAVTDCGDGLVYPGEEQCDDGADNGTHGRCKADCTGPGPFCGDGTIDAIDEACDDGDSNGAYGSCSDDCSHISQCGDGTLEPFFEACDDGSANGTSGSCRSDCLGMQDGQVCGDGVVEPPELCDFGAGYTGPACDAGCTNLEFTVSSAAHDNLGNPDVIATRDGFTVLYETFADTGDLFNVRRRRLDGQGTALDADPVLAPADSTHSETDPRGTALPAGGVVAVWIDWQDQALQYRRFDGTGGAIDAAEVDVAVPPDNGHGLESVDAGPFGGFTVSWPQRTGTAAGVVVARSFNAGGAPLGPVYAVHHPVAGYSASAVTMATLPGGDQLFSFTTFLAVGGDYAIKTARFSPMGEERQAADVPVSTSGTVYFRSAPETDCFGHAAVGPSCIVAWIDSAGAVRARLVGADGSPFGANDFIVSASGSAIAVAALPDERFVAVWPSNGISAQLIDSAASLVGTPATVSADTAARKPRLAVGAHGLLACYNAGASGATEVRCRLWPAAPALTLD